MDPWAINDLFLECEDQLIERVQNSAGDFLKGVKGGTSIHSWNVLWIFVHGFSRFAPDVFSSILCILEFNEFQILFEKTNENFYEKC